MTTPIYELDEISENQGSKYLTHNEALRVLEILTSRVLSSIVSAEPGSPSEGDAYILPSSPTGATWSTYSANDIAMFIGGAWRNLTPKEGFSVWDNNANQQVTWNGSSWVAAAGISEVLSDTTPQLGGNLDLNTKGFTIEATAGEAQASGDWCYLKSDGKMWKSNATDDTASITLIAIATETTVADATHTYQVGGIFTTTGLTAGSTYYLSTTDGAITETAPNTTGNVVRVVGYAISSTQLFMSIDQSYTVVP